MRAAACLAVLAALTTTVGAAAAPARRVIRVPQDAATPARAIALAHPGDTIVLAPARYPGGYVIPPAKHDLTIRGVERNGVVLDGGDSRKNGFLVRADGVSILNLSAHDFLENGVYWKDANRYRGAYLTVWNVRGYGIYVEDGVDGTLDHDYVSGAADAAFYIGECRPCRASVEHVVARLSAIGYSGTNSTGVSIRDSLWDRNGAGIVPNSYANEALPPAARTTIVGNTIVGSGRAPVPIRTALAGFVGIGIAIAGAGASSVTDNRVTGSELYGIALFSTARFVTFDPHVRRDPGPRWRASGNRVVRNVVEGSSRADLALAAGAGSGNCFSANVARTTLPLKLQTAMCAAATGGGDPTVAAALQAPVRKMFRDALKRRRAPDYRSMPRPGPQPDMPAR